MKVLMGLLLAAGAALMLPGCAGTVGVGYYDQTPGYYPGYYTYNNDRPFLHRPYEPYRWHGGPRPVVRAPVVVRHDGGHGEVHGELHARE